MIANDFINNCIAMQSAKNVKYIMDYVNHAKENGARVCNDGYPDTRFKATYPPEFEKARRFISRCRQHHAAFYPKACSKQGRLF